MTVCEPLPAGSFNIAWENGGPAGLVYGWILVAVMTMTVAIGMAEIVSALPSSGGPYFWSAHLASKRYSPFAAWMTGAQGSCLEVITTC